MPLPKPNLGEGQDEFIGRCMSFVKDEDKDISQNHAVAMCFSQWRQSKKLSYDGDSSEDPSEVMKRAIKEMEGE